MVRRPVFNTSLPARASLLVVLVGALVVASPVFGRGTDSKQANGGQVVLVDKTFECSTYKQPVDFDLVKVTINAGVRGRVDAIHTGDRCTGRIGRIEVDTWNADGMKVHPGTHDLVIQGGYVRCHGRVGAVHQDGIQAMGGERVTFKNLTVDCTTASNGALFIAEGRDRRQLPTDIVCDGCTLIKGPTSTRVVRIATSLRSGARNSTIVWCGNGPGCTRGDPLVFDSSAQQPIDQNNRFVLYSDYGTNPPPTTPTTPTTGPALLIRQFGLSSASPRDGTRLAAQLTVSGLSAGADTEAVCGAAVAGKAIRAVGRSSRGSASRCVFVVPKDTDGLLTGLVGLTSGGSTVNRSFTVRVVSDRRKAVSGGRVAAQLRPVAPGVSPRRFVVSNQRPAAGSKVFATISLAGLGGSRDASIRCSGAAGGKPLQVLGSGFRAPDASCGWRIPAGTGGKALRLSMSLVTPQGPVFTHSFHLSVAA